MAVKVNALFNFEIKATSVNTSINNGGGNMAIIIKNYRSLRYERAVIRFLNVKGNSSTEINKELLHKKVHLWRGCHILKTKYTKGEGCFIQRGQVLIIHKGRNHLKSVLSENNFFLCWSGRFEAQYSVHDEDLITMSLHH